MNASHKPAAIAWLALVVSVVAACSGSPSPSDAAVDTGVTLDVATDVAMQMDAVTAHDVNDAGSPMDTSASDTTPPVDVAPGADGSDVTTSDVVAPIDVVVPVDVTDVPSPVDAGAPDVIATSDSGTSCVVDTDCVGTGMRCGYLIADACSATGTCVMMPPGSPCGAIVLLSGCGCSGTTVNWTGGCHPQYPPGYAPAAISHMGPCP